VEEAGVKHILLPGDLVNESVCQEWIDQTISQLGKIDILVNNASTQEQSLESFTHIKRFFLTASIFLLL
jgi:NAD(P)-dependent dehydrogenase (short-subunit alcohol dehydrogenase family)